MLGTAAVGRGLDNVATKMTLVTMWCVWAGLLLGELTFMAVVAVRNTHEGEVAKAQDLLMIINVVMLLTMAPAAYLARRAIFKRARRGDGTLPPGTYGLGSIVFWAGCEGVSFFGLVAAMLNRTLWPTVLVAAVAMLLQVLTWPKMRMMRVMPVAPAKERAKSK